MSMIKFKIAAKTNVGRVRTNNEDNFQAACDLTTAPMKWVNDMECDLGEKGALLVVADGMGGMNAGEVASEIAINTIREFFSPEKITNKVLESRVGIETFMKNSIVEADKAIKKTAKENPEHKGMGTTIVIAWILNDTLYVAWCGDSRAYLYNHITGLKQISKDHSVVQSLVDKGKISAEDAFDYPDSNIITRCLSDSSQKARPDTLSHPITVHNNDIVLLCTDGLSGMIRDHEIEQVMANYEDNMSDCCDQLIEAACEAAGEDNVTVALCKIVSGATEKQKTSKKTRLNNTISFSKSGESFISKKLINRIVVFLLTIGLFLGGGFLMGRNSMSNENHTKGEIVDSVSANKMNILQHQNDSLKECVDKLLADTVKLGNRNRDLHEINNILRVTLSKKDTEIKALKDENDSIKNQLSKRRRG